MAARVLWYVLCIPVAVYCQTLVPVITGPRPYPQAPVPPISNADMDSAFNSAQQEIASRNAQEAELSSNGGIIPPTSHSANARHQRFVGEYAPAIKMDQIQELFEGATRSLAQSQGLTPDQIRFGLPDVPLTSNNAAAAVQQCQAMYNVQCTDSKYRTADGSCNNLANPTWGKAFTCFQRLLPANYADGVSIPRVSVVDGSPLPNPRLISTVVHDDVFIEATSYTHMVMQFGQFIDHDITLTPMTRTANLSMIQCCPDNILRHPECFPIDIPPTDGFFAQFGETCINFVRSAACTQCYLGPRDQTDQLTAYVDGSQVYGSSLNETTNLRSFSQGLLKFTPSALAGPLLPPSQDPNNDQCSNVTQNQICFQAGDERANEHPSLTSMHTIWLRQHNRIAEELAVYNPGWNDEKLFQETRKIIGAQIQMILYNEFLPVVLGTTYMSYFKLQVSPPTASGSGRTNYDQGTEPTILHEFATAAYRFGHTLIRNLFNLGSRGQNGALALKDNFFNPFPLFDGNQIENIMSGLSGQPAMDFDNHIVQAVTNFVYKPQNEPFGMDLPALNLQRGRDHGLNSYTDYLNYCFNLNINSFSDLSQVMNSDVIQRFQSLYKNVNDIDLFSGGVSERSLPGAVVGPTFGCIIGLQFFHLKYGDRYYFEHASQTGSFTNDQLYQIKQTALGRVICANSNINSIQPYVFLPPGTSYSSNPVVSCDSIVELDLGPWAGQ